MFKVLSTFYQIYIIETFIRFLKKIAHSPTIKQSFWKYGQSKNLLKSWQSFSVWPMPKKVPSCFRMVITQRTVCVYVSFEYHHVMIGMIIFVNKSKGHFPHIIHNYVYIYYWHSSSWYYFKNFSNMTLQHLSEKGHVVRDTFIPLAS